MSEFDLQKFTAAILGLKAKPGVIWFHPPNGEHRSKRTGAKLQAMGVRKGVADMVVIMPGGLAHFLELKMPKGATKPEQRLFRDACDLAGCPYAIARSSADIERILTSWGAI